MARVSKTRPAPRKTKYGRIFMALAVVAGASTAGECAAPGMHTRRARRRLAMSS